MTNIVLCVLLKGGVPRRVAPLISEDFFFPPSLLFHLSYLFLFFYFFWLPLRLYAGSIPHARNNA